MKTYIVMNYDTIAYAGQSLREAKRHTRGNSSIQIWQRGRYVGYWEHQFTKGWILQSFAIKA
jgi:hypothetical protein